MENGMNIDFYFLITQFLEGGLVAAFLWGGASSGQLLDAVMESLNPRSAAKGANWAARSARDIRFLWVGNG